MAEAKTKKNEASVEDYIDAIEDEQRRDDCREIAALMSKLTDDKGSMWGKDIVGYGSYTYVYASGKSGDWPLTGFSNRKNAISIYTMIDVNADTTLTSKLGKFKNGKSCIYVKKLDDIDTTILEKVIIESIAKLKELHG